MSRVARFFFHSVAVAVLGFGIYYDVNIVKPPQEYLDKSVKFAGRWKYLTFIDVNVQCWYFLICLVNDIVGSDTADSNKRSPIQKIRDGVFSSLAFPFAAFVCASFWLMFAIDRDLVYPEALDEFIPVWLNHIMHTAILPFAMVELIISPHVYPSTVTGLLRSGAAMVAYVLWTFYIAFHTGHWVYPILEMLGWTYRSLFIFGCMLLAMLFCVVGKTLNDLVWGKTKKTETSQKKTRNRKKTKEQ